MTLFKMRDRLRAARRSDELLVRNRYVLLADVVLVAAAAFLAFALRFDLGFIGARPEFFPFLLAVVVLKPIVLFFFGMYRRFWRYVSLNDVLVLALSVSAASILVAVVIGAAAASRFVVEFSRAVLLIDWLITLVMVTSVRAAVRLLGESRRRVRTIADAAQSKRVVVVGAGEAGAMVVREMQRNPHIGMLPVGFLDDDRRKHGKGIYGVPVLGPTSAVERVVNIGRVEEVIIAMPRASGALVRAVAERCRALELPCRTMPGVYELLDDQVSVTRLRKVEISDLLRRAQVHLSAADGYIEDRSVLITGAGGSIGAELARQVAHSKPRRLILLGHGENSIFSVYPKLVEQHPGLEIHPVLADVRNAARLDAVFERFKPDVVFHAAAHKHVPLMEVNPEEAFTNNVRGTANVLRAAGDQGVERLVLVSTDKAVAPSSIMGASKRLAEYLVLQAGKRHRRAYVVVRFGNVLGSRGSVVPTFQAQIERGGPIKITHPDMKRFFMTIAEAVQLVLRAGGMGTGGDLFVLNMGEQVRVLDLANDLMRLSGVDPAAIPIEFTGIRPGEKLEEVLWESGATVEATSHPDILLVREPDAEHDFDIAPLVDDIVAAAESGDAERLMMTLAVAVPTFNGTPPLTGARRQ